MRVLIAEDDAVSRRVLEGTLGRWGHEVVVTTNGAEAWEALQQADAPAMAILDWMMPGIDGVDVCRRVRETPRDTTPYIILLTAKGAKEDVVEGLDAGADDYVTKPFDREELRARVRAGERILSLQQALGARVQELQDALTHVKTLQGILPICSYCKKIRDSHDAWMQVESYVSQHSDAEFSHGICPGCWDSVIQPELDALGAGQDAPA
jgi:phosphoserine phosphatase RsbU/P